MRQVLQNDGTSAKRERKINKKKRTLGNHVTKMSLFKKYNGNEVLEPMSNLEKIWWVQKGQTLEPI